MTPCSAPDCPADAVVIVRVTEVATAEHHWPPPGQDGHVQWAWCERHADGAVTGMLGWVAMMGAPK